MITQFLKPLPILYVMAALALPAAATAQSGPPPELPITEMAAQMGVTESALENCLPRPERGERPERPEPAAIAGCLQIDETIVGAALKENAPAMPRRSN